MKRIALYLAAVAAAVFLAGCASSAPANTTSQPAPANANTGVSFAGFWQLPSGSRIQFINQAFLFQNQEGKVVNTGTFTYTDTKFTLNLDVGSSATNDYTVVNSETIRVASAGNNWANGNWRKLNGLSWTANNHPLVGYYERKTEEEIVILLITPFGWGDEFTCDLEYNLIGRKYLSYDEDNHSEFKAVSVFGDFTATFSYEYVFDGEDLLVGTRGVRYIRVPIRY